MLSQKPAKAANHWQSNQPNLSVIASRPSRQPRPGENNSHGVATHVCRSGRCGKRLFCTRDQRLHWAALERNVSSAIDSRPYVSGDTLTQGRFVRQGRETTRRESE